LGSASWMSLSSSHSNLVPFLFRFCFLAIEVPPFRTIEGAPKGCHSDSAGSKDAVPLTLWASLVYGESA
jgi:hypothetical protein